MIDFRDAVLPFAAGTENQCKTFLLSSSCKSSFPPLHLHKPSNAIFLSLMPVKGANHRNQSSEKLNKYIAHGKLKPIVQTMKILHIANWHIGQPFLKYNHTIKHQQLLNWPIKRPKVRSAIAISRQINRPEPY